MLLLESQAQFFRGSVRAVAQVPNIYIHCHACSIFGGGSVCQWSLHASLQVLNQSLHNVQRLLCHESTLLAATARALALLSCIIKSMAMSAPANNTSAVLDCCCSLICNLGCVNAAGTVAIHNPSVKLLQADEQGGTVIMDRSGVLLPTAPISLTLKHLSPARYNTQACSCWTWRVVTIQSLTVAP